MARTAEITFKEFRRRYNSEDACRAELFRLRFLNGFVCPKRGCVKLLRNSDQCRSSRHQTSVTAEPVMHCTRLPLTLWFWSHFRRASDKFNKAIEEIDKTIATLQKVKED